MNFSTIKTLLVVTLIACAPLGVHARHHKTRSFLNFLIDVVDYGYGRECNRLVGEIDYLLHEIDHEMDRFVVKFSRVHDFQLRDTQVVIQDIGYNWIPFVADLQVRFGIHASDLYAMRDALSDILYEMEVMPSARGSIFDSRLDRMHNFYMDATTAMDHVYSSSLWRMAESFNRIAGIIRSI